MVKLAQVLYKREMADSENKLCDKMKIPMSVRGDKFSPFPPEAASLPRPPEGRLVPHDSEGRQARQRLRLLPRPSRFKLQGQISGERTGARPHPSPRPSLDTSKRVSPDKQQGQTIHLGASSPSCGRRRKRAGEAGERGTSAYPAPCPLASPRPDCRRA